MMAFKEITKSISEPVLKIINELGIYCLWFYLKCIYQKSLIMVKKYKRNKRSSPILQIHSIIGEFLQRRTIQK